jgi:hypothetical protein
MLKIKFKNPIRIHFWDLSLFILEYNAKVKDYLSDQIIASIEMKFE